jgi:hypothetical protein
MCARHWESRSSASEWRADIGSAMAGGGVGCGKRPGGEKAPYSERPGTRSALTRPSLAPGGIRVPAGLTLFGGVWQPQNLLWLGVLGGAKEPKPSQRRLSFARRYEVACCDQNPQWGARARRGEAMGWLARRRRAGVVPGCGDAIETVTIESDDGGRIVVGVEC